MTALKLLLVTLAATCAEELLADRDDESAALKDGVCTQNVQDLCSNTYSFTNVEAPQDQGVLSRVRLLKRQDASVFVPGRVYAVYDGLLDEVLKWLEELEGQNSQGNLLGWSDEALRFMDEALKDDPLSAFEVYAPSKPDDLPQDIKTYLIHAPGFRSQAKDLKSRPPVLKGGGRRLFAAASGDDGSPVEADSAHDRRQASIFPSGNPYGPNDDRVQVLYPNNLYWAWSTLGSTGNRASRWCSGTMISPTVLLTAAHCVATIGTMNNPGGVNWLTQPQICIRDVQRSTPTAASPSVMDCESNDGILATWTRMTTFVKWARDSDRDWDIGWITLSSPVGYTSGWKGIRTADYSPGTIINVAGYGGDCPAGGDCSDNLKTMGCAIEPDPSCISTSSHPNRYYYECDTIGGMSGSGAYVYYPNSEPPDNRFVIGVHAYGFDCSGQNRAIRIRPSILEAMCANTDDMLCYSSSAAGAQPTCQ